MFDYQAYTHIENSMDLIKQPENATLDDLRIALDKINRDSIKKEKE